MSGGYQNKIKYLEGELFEARDLVVYLIEQWAYDKGVLPEYLAPQAFPHGGVPAWYYGWSKGPQA